MAQKKKAEVDPAVVHPAHYNFAEGFEVIDVISAWALNFNRGNSIKYIARASRKSKATEIQDLEKAVFYLQHEIALLKEA